MAVNPTLTTTTFANNPAKYVQTGVVSQSGSFNSGSGTLGTAGDTVFLCKIPHGAILLDFAEDHSTGATTAVYSSGLSTGGASGGGGSLSLLIAAGVQATVNRANVNGTLPMQVSCSDLDPNRYGVLSMTCATGSRATSSLILNGRVWYRRAGLFWAASGHSAGLWKGPRHFFRGI